MTEFLWIAIPVALLPVAAASGWFAARRSARREHEAAPGKNLRSDYFRGINYLLDEQPDKAIEAFIRVLEVDSETVETHLALGNLYRRRGEVDRAIRIHQNLIARPTLNLEQRNEALLELGYDYMSAGLLDRAENLFQELCEKGSYAIRALRQVTDIYEQEKDWDNAIASARKLEKITGERLGSVIAHYYCEKAELAARNNHTSEALRAAERALESHAGCVRASLLEGEIRVRDEDYESAVAAYQRVASQDPDFLPVTIDPLRNCYRKIDRPQELRDYLMRLMDGPGGIVAAFALTEMKREVEGHEAAIKFITDHLRGHPSVRGLDRLLALEMETAEGTGREHVAMLKILTARLLENRPEYKCEHCGFPAKSLHWQCPACKHWNAVKPIQGVEGE